MDGAETMWARKGQFDPCRNKMAESHGGKVAGDEGSLPVELLEDLRAANLIDRALFCDARVRSHGLRGAPAHAG